MRPVCQLMIFIALYTTLPHNLIKEKLKMFNWVVILKGKVLHTLTVTKEMRSLLLNTKLGINFGLI